MIAPSSVMERLASLAAVAPNGAERVAAMLAEMTPLEAASLTYDWELWRKPKQRPPVGAWSSWGALTGRGFGKSRANAEFVHGEAASGDAMRIALVCQNEDRCIEVMVEGESGLVAVSPPWFKARFEAGRVIWPNGAQAFIYTPERPGDIFGPEHHLAWASELHAWPQSKMAEAFDNLLMGLRLGYGRLVWDSNPRRRHPLITSLLAEGAADPARHVVVRGSTRENRLNLTPGVVEQWERKYAGTQRGREMLDGEQTLEDEGALWEQAWIDDHRREAPPTLRRRILVADPAISMREGTDATGISDQGLDTDDQVLVFADLSKRLPWADWGDLLVKRYFAKRCDCIVLERNRGGDSCTANVRTAAEKLGRELGRDIRVEVVAADAVTRHSPNVIMVKEVVGRTSKGTRAEPVAAHYQAGRVSHVIGGEGLSDLEDLLTTWNPDGGGESPNPIDALVYGVIELAGLGREAKPRSNVVGAAKLQATVTATTAQPNIAALLGGGSGGDRI
jgi:phage terminase large subunit-like protein